MLYIELLATCKSSYPCMHPAVFDVSTYHIVNMSDGSRWCVINIHQIKFHAKVSHCITRWAIIKDYFRQYTGRTTNNL